MVTIVCVLLDAAKRYYRTCREEESRRRRGVAVQRKDQRRKEERISRVRHLYIHMYYCIAMLLLIIITIDTICYYLHSAEAQGAGSFIGKVQPSRAL